MWKVPDEMERETNIGEQLWVVGCSTRVGVMCGFLGLFTAGIAKKLPRISLTD